MDEDVAAEIAEQLDIIVGTMEHAIQTMMDRGVPELLGTWCGKMRTALLAQGFSSEEATRIIASSNVNSAFKTSS